MSQKRIYHKAVVVFIINSKNEILIQQRSNNKKLWPDKWDITAGGHVDAGKFGYEAVIRETKEEIGIDISDDCITKVLEVKPNEKKPKFTDIYFVIKEVDIDDIKLQLEEVSEVKYVSLDELVEIYRNDNPDFINHSFFPELIDIVSKLIK